MKLRERLRLDRLRPPKNRGPLAYIKRKLYPKKTIPNRNLTIFLNTYCNLNCFSCAALGMETRPPAVDTSLKDIEAFLKHMSEIYSGNYVLLTGGEPTMYPLLSQVCDMIHSYDFKVAMITNGFKIFPPELFDFIILDYHGINEDKLNEWLTVLRNSGIAWDSIMKQYHQNIQLAMKDNITKGARCAYWLKPLTLWQNVVYPCCNIQCVEWWHDTFEVSEALIDAGWTVDNPDLIGVIKNWRETLPSEFYRLCTVGCWKDADKATWSQITRARTKIKSS